MCGQLVTHKSLFRFPLNDYDQVNHRSALPHDVLLPKFAHGVIRQPFRKCLGIKAVKCGPSVPAAHDDDLARIEVVEQRRRLR